MTAITNTKRRKYQFYRHPPSRKTADVFVIPEDCRSNYHLFYILLKNQETRDALMNYLQRSGILYLQYDSLHGSPMGQWIGYRVGDLPVTEDLAGRLLRLPLYHEITIDEQARVVGQIRKFLRSSRWQRSAA